MSLPDSWTNKPNTIPQYFEAIQRAEPPERFSVKFLERLGFRSTNDRKFIAILKTLGFLDADGKPTSRYFEYLDSSRSKKVLAQAIREAFADLFAIHKDAHTLAANTLRDKLRTLYAGTKKANIIAYIVKTFMALVQCADFGAPDESGKSQVPTVGPTVTTERSAAVKASASASSDDRSVRSKNGLKPLAIEGLQYHINIVLPESRDQAIYDAIFKALRDHLG